jgi:hypothetical protein
MFALDVNYLFSTCSQPIRYDSGVQDSYQRYSVRTLVLMDLIHLSMSDALATLEPNDRSIFHGETEYQSIITRQVQLVPTSRTSIVKKRAARACRYCRGKKIKCSLVKSGSPCNTCQLDEVECIITVSRRNKSRRAPRIPNGRLASICYDSDQRSKSFEQVTVPIDVVNSKSRSPQCSIASSSSQGA